MSFEKQASEAVQMLIAEGVEPNDAAELVMEKIAGTAMDIALLGHARAERKYAEAQGKAGPEKGIWKDYKHNVKHHLPIYLTTGLAGGLGAGVGHTLGNKFAKTRGGAIGSTLAGYAAGAYGAMAASTKHSANKIHEKYAAVNMLVEEGFDLDSAVSLVQAKSAELYGD